MSMRPRSLSASAVRYGGKTARPTSIGTWHATPFIPTGSTNRLTIQFRTHNERRFCITVFFTADTHFGDYRTINIQRRPFATVDEMDALLIANWNAVVGIDDEVWHLGDVTRRPLEIPVLPGRLNGHKHLLRGNNDSSDTVAATGWDSTGDYVELALDGRRLVLCHYLFRSWEWSAPRIDKPARP